MSRVRRGWQDPAAGSAAWIGAALGVMAGFGTCTSALGMILDPTSTGGGLPTWIPRFLLWTAALWMPVALGLLFRWFVARTTRPADVEPQTPDLGWMRGPVIATFATILVIAIIAASGTLPINAGIFLFLPLLCFWICVCAAFSPRRDEAKNEEQKR